MKRKAIVFSAVAALVVGALVTYVVSSPVFSLNNNGSWVDALANNITGVAVWNAAFENAYPGQSAQLRVPDLTVGDVGDPGNKQGIAMAWGSAADDGQDIIAAWEYTYGVDPDLSNVIMTVDVFPPCSMINSISIGLKDQAGNIRSWLWNVPPMTCGAVTTVTINPFVGAGGANPPADGYYNGPGFNLAQVVSLIFCENGTWVAGAPAPPIGPVHNVWNYWRNLNVAATVPVETRTWGAIKELYKD